MGIFLGIAFAFLMLLSLPAMAAPPAAHSAVKHNNAGVDFFSAAKYDQAIVEYTKAIQDNPRYAEAYSNRGAAYDALNRSDKAVEDYSRAITLDPGFTAAYSNRAAALAELKRYSEALPDWQVVVNRSPDSSSAYLGRGICWKQAGNLKAAIADFQSAIKLNPRDDKAIQQLHDAEKMLPSTAVLPQNTMSASTQTPGSSAEVSRRDAGAPGAGANSTGASAISSASGFAAICADTVHQLLGGLCLATGQYQSAADHYRQAAIQNPADAFAHFRYGNICSLQGDERTALKEYELAVQCSQHFRQAYVRRERLKRTIVVPASSDASTTEHAP